MNNTLKNIWCDFVLNEGLMPAPIVRIIKNNASENTRSDDDYLNIAEILYLREGYNKRETAIQAAISQIAPSAFVGDFELNVWLEKMSNILKMICMGFSAIGEGVDMEDMVIGAMSSFIKSCPLVNDNNKSKYVNLLNPKSRFAVSSPRVSGSLYSKKGRKDAFESYLIEQEYKPATVNVYKSAINIIGDMCGCNLWDCENVEDLEVIYQDKIQPDFKKFDEEDRRRNRALSNGWKRYLEFCGKN